MDFVTAFNKKPCFLYDGPMETRIEFDTNLKLDNEMSIFTLIFSEEGKSALRKLYSEDIAIAEQYNLPIIINAPTYRANPAHCKRLGFDLDEIEKINLKCVQFAKEIRQSFPDYKDNIFVTAPIGPKLSGYAPDYESDIAYMTRFYAVQADALAKAKVDIISIAAMTGFIEALGSAEATANAGVPYSVGLVLTPEGTLLDGTPIGETIQKIDNRTKIAPNFYVISCTHPKTAMAALKDSSKYIHRIKGIKANGSDKPPKELAKLDHPVADDPQLFAKEVVALGNQFHLKVYGGCCGTDSRHLAAIAKELTTNVK